MDLWTLLWIVFLVGILCAAVMGYLAIRAPRMPEWMEELDEKLRRKGE